MRVVIAAEGGSARRDRLLRELRRAAQVTHESFARVLEVGTTESGDVFVEVMESEGERLSERLRRGAPFEERVAALIAAQIARALAAAHDAGVVHRELRPSVIMLVGEGDATRVMVEGLAIPRLAAPGAEDPEAAYAAPEQLGGGSVGRRADVYSIGAMLYAMLTGEAPRPSAAPIESALGDVVRRCLAQDPRERFLDTVALSAALRAAMAPASERPPPVSQRPVSSPAISARPPASVRPPTASEPALGRAPAAPPPRPLGRPLTARPRWEEALLDLGDGPLPRVALTTVVAFVIARILTSGFVPFVVAVAAGVAAYATNYFRKSRADHSDR